MMGRKIAEKEEREGGRHCKRKRSRNLQEKKQEGGYPSSFKEKLGGHLARVLQPSPELGKRVD